MHIDHFDYPVGRVNKGRTQMVTSIGCYMLLSFFLLAGFHDKTFTPFAFFGLSLVMTAMFLEGLGQYRSGIGGIEVDHVSITGIFKKKRTVLLFEEIHTVRMGGILQPALVLKGNRQKLRIYKSLIGYPQLWARLHQHMRLPCIDNEMIRIRCHTRQIGTFISSFVLLIVVSIFLLTQNTVSVPAMPWVLTILFIPAFICLYVLLHGCGEYVFAANGVTYYSLLRKKEYPASSFRQVILESAPVRPLISGWRYRGEAMTPVADYLRQAPGLRLKIMLADEELVLDETMTGFPLELLFDALLEKYNLPGYTGVYLPKACVC